jgi:hypothetical protein
MAQKTCPRGGRRQRPSVQRNAPAKNFGGGIQMRAHRARTKEFKLDYGEYMNRSRLILILGSLLCLFNCRGPTWDDANKLIGTDATNIQRVFGKPYKIIEGIPLLTATKDSYLKDTYYLNYTNWGAPSIPVDGNFIINIKPKTKNMYICPGLMLPNCYSIHFAISSNNKILWFFADS